MEVTKCDRCGVYVDKSPSNMPVIAYRYRKNDVYEENGSTVKKSLCYECYNKFLNWIGNNKEESDDQLP